MSIYYLTFECSAGNHNVCVYPTWPRTLEQENECICDCDCHKGYGGC
jgi:hypothetical protein